MSPLEPGAGERIVSVLLTEYELVVGLVDGRTISAPLAKLPRLLYASSVEREDWVIVGCGFGIH